MNVSLGDVGKLLLYSLATALFLTVTFWWAFH
ncbi:Hypothetical protein LUCI_2651 [Lucifera butyrica]|uniref:Uncharacterized protein n=1 Tax=Lucifera butyrica TaxID=1351585 RepID=A0A498R8U6_9FIRM|nr:Hypothetical protein LUCI_2651 [Lucifera butyrica]